MNMEIFLGVIGCIDKTHRPIKHPSTPDPEEYRNQNNGLVQGACTPQLQFLNNVASWEHDYFFGSLKAISGKQI